MVPGDATHTSLRAPPLRLPADQSRSALWKTASRAAHRSPVPLDTYEREIPPETQRQYLFANALYVNALHFHRIGALNLVELHGHLRVICRNRIFREYWAATQRHRDSLPDSSEEAALGRMTEGPVQELHNLADDTDDGDLEEWWVVGELPGE